MNSTLPLNIIIPQKPIAFKLLPPIDKSQVPHEVSSSLSDSVDERAYRCERMASYGDGPSGEGFDKDLPRFFFGSLREGDCQLAV